jgi:hypothetical protein
VILRAQWHSTKIKRGVTVERRGALLIALCLLLCVMTVQIACTPDETDGDGDSDGDGDADAEVCDPEAECCLDQDCSDRIFCNGVEICDRGVCEPDPRSYIDPATGARVLNCDDGIACTRDECNELANVCEHIPVHTVCDNSDLCDGVEQCEPSNEDADEEGCIPGRPMICDDGKDNNCDHDADYANPSYVVPNDTCDDAILLTQDVTVYNSTRGTAGDIESSCAPAAHRDVAFVFSISEVQDVEIEV